MRPKHSDAQIAKARSSINDSRKCNAGDAWAEKHDGKHIGCQ